MSIIGFRPVQTGDIPSYPRSMPRDHEADTDSVRAGHEPADHIGSLKPPIYESTTFAFETAEEMERAFGSVYGLEGAEVLEPEPLIYARLDSPSIRAAEARVSAWEGAEESLLFNSGMSAITTLLLTLASPGRAVLHSTPLYGGTTVVIKGLLKRMGISAVAFSSSDSAEDLLARVEGLDVALVYAETPANPTNDLVDLDICRRVAEEMDAPLVVDNTFLSPVFQRPLELGATFSLNSATKYLGGHSDLTAGVVSGAADSMRALRHNRYRWGSTAAPATGWLLARSLETLRLRVTRQAENASMLASFLSSHDKVESVTHLSLLSPGGDGYEVYKRQCLGPGAMISFEVAGGKQGAFRLLNSIRLVSLATSLGGSESLASHPGSTSHSTMSDRERSAVGVSPGLIRLSVGLEDPSDLVADFARALSHV